jgi:hypothetical protein
MIRTTLTAFTIGASLGAAASANGSVYAWSWERGDPGSYGINDNGGHLQNVDAVFNTVSNDFTWSVTFSNQVTSGMTLAVNNGPNPKGHAGELALLYVDASDAANPLISAYAYNGKNTRTSYRDGDGNTSGNQTPDLIHGVNDQSWVSSVALTDNSDGSRTIAFSIDASTINNHNPMYPDATDPWYGIGFEEQLGLWMHPYRNFNPSYNADGSIDNLPAGGEGWFDGSGFDTTTVFVPTPGAAGLLALSGLLATRRRR